MTALIGRYTSDFGALLELKHASDGKINGSFRYSEDCGSCSEIVGIYCVRNMCNTISFSFATNLQLPGESPSIVTWIGNFTQDNRLKELDAIRSEFDDGMCSSVREAFKTDPNVKSGIDKLQEDLN
eukprot:775955_1